MINCLLVDDEAPARVHLARLLRQHADVHVDGEASHGLEALQQIAERPPAVVFLDIDMPGLNGVELARQLPVPPLVVFVTAYDQYAVQAFEANAVDYLLKPVTPARLAQALAKVRVALGRPVEEYRAALHAALGAIQPRTISKLAAERGRHIVLLSPKDVLCAVAAHKLVFVLTATERLIVNRTLEQLESLLEDAGFVRISRSVLMNLEHAKELMPSSSGTWKVRLSNGSEVGVSRERARRLRERLATRPAAPNWISRIASGTKSV